jgi:hypothetical protein
MARALELLHQVGAPLIGTVLNGVSGESGYGFQYGYSSDPPKGTPVKPLKPLKPLKPVKGRKSSADDVALKPATNGRTASPPPATRTRAAGPAALGRRAKAIEGSKGRTEDRPGQAPIA